MSEGVALWNRRRAGIRSFRCTACQSILVTWLAGCSLSVQGPNPKRPASESPKCDRSASGRTLLDVVGGTLFFAATIALYADIARGRSPGVAVASGLASAGYWPSAIAGGRRISQCAAEYRRYEKWLTANTDKRQRPPPPTAEALCRGGRGQQARVACQKWCEPFVSAWRAETNPRRKTAAYDSMPAECRSSVTKRHAGD